MHISNNIKLQAVLYDIQNKTRERIVAYFSVLYNTLHQLPRSGLKLFFTRLAVTTECCQVDTNVWSAVMKGVKFNSVKLLRGYLMFWGTSTHRHTMENSLNSGIRTNETTFFGAKYKTLIRNQGWKYMAWSCIFPYQN